MKDIVRLILALTLIASIAGLILSQVEMATREPIKEQRRIQMLKAITAVLPSYDNSPDTDKVELQDGLDKKGRPQIKTFYRGRNAGALSGIAFKVTAGDGYSGKIVIMVGLNQQDSLSGIEILTHAETPGLGARIIEPAFKDQFKGKNLENADWRVKKDGGQFDQITGATISPRAIVKAVKAGLEFYRTHKAGITAQGGVK